MRPPNPAKCKGMETYLHSLGRDVLIQCEVAAFLRTLLVLVTHDVIHGHGHGLELGPSITEALLMISITKNLIIRLVVKKYTSCFTRL